jgi:hypothetical protein
MLGMLHQAKCFNQDISNWNVSNVISMDMVFSDAEGYIDEQ